MTYKLTPVLLEGLASPFTLSDETTQGVVTLRRYRITVITSDFQSEDLGSIPGTCSNKPYRSPNSADERNLGSHRIATFTESLNVPRYSVMDPALMCTSTGDGEQTIDQIQTRGEHGRFVFFYGPDADGRSTDLQSDRLGSIPTVSTMGNTVASC